MYSIVIFKSFPNNHNARIGTHTLHRRDIHGDILPSYISFFFGSLFSFCFSYKYHHFPSPFFCYSLFFSFVMPSLPPPPPRLLLLLLFVVTTFFVAPAACTSRSRALLHPKLLTDGIRITLHHVDSGKNLTKFEKFQRGMKRSEHRLNRLSSAISSMSSLAEDKSSVFGSEVHAGNGEFLMKLSIGSPPESFNAIMDTGSDLIWTQCKPCKKCFHQPNPLFDPTKSSSFSYLTCSDKLCKSLPTSSCQKQNCEYVYAYGDSSSTYGKLGTETFTFDKVSVPNIRFGCGEDNEGAGFQQGSGIVGLGRGVLSLVSQLNQPKFSYCLTSVDDTKSSSALLMGSLADLNSTSSGESKPITTPLLINPTQSSFYYISLVGISVGGTRVPIDKSTFAIKGDGTGGLIVDSGTTITYLEETGFKALRKEFLAQTKLEVDDSGSTGLELCFKIPAGVTDIEIPTLMLHFDGADMNLPSANYVIADESVGLVCLAMGSSNGMSIFGNVQQQNMLVVHDLVKETMSFVPTQCNKL